MKHSGSLRGIRNRLEGEKFLDYLRGEVKLRGINNTLRLFTEEELQLLHEATLQILEDPGMRIAEMGFLEALDGKGAVVDYQKREARFPRALIQENIKMM